MVRLAMSPPAPGVPPKPHALAFIADEPCPNCGCEWMRPTVRFGTEDEAEAAEGSACANLWCPMIRQLRNRIANLTADRLALARLAAETPQFNSPVAAWAAQALRDKLLGAVPASPPRAPTGETT